MAKKKEKDEMGNISEVQIENKMKQIHFSVDKYKKLIHVPHFKGICPHC